MNQKRFYVTVAILAGFAITVVCTLFLLDPIMWLIVYEQTDLVPGTLSYEQWVHPRIDIYFQAYLFNVTNPVEFLAGQKPVIRQLGPYTYRESRMKINISSHFVPRTVEYKEMKEYYFDPSMSVGLESDNITTVSLGYLAIDTKFGWLPSVIDRVIVLLEEWAGEHLIIQKTVKEILWGYEDPFLAFLKRRGIPVGSTMIGLYYGKNSTDDGLVEVYANNKNREDFGHIYKYHSSATLSCWTTPQANQINGSDGALFHPFMESTEHPYIFSADICRSIHLQPTSMANFQGVSLIKYLPYNDTFSSALKEEKNRGFCIHWPNCLGDNVLDMSTCMPGAPIVMSLPHLRFADPSYREGVIGLNPTDDMNSSFSVEPITGAVFHASKQLQINAIVSNDSKFPELSRVRSVFLPLMYMNESFHIDEDTVTRIRSSLVQGPFWSKLVLSTLAVCLLTCLVLAGLYWVLERRRLSRTGISYSTLPAEPEMEEPQRPVERPEEPSSI